ncbi:MAG: glutamate-5-semialdehyde dehydrogenase [Rhodospirillaceae bacterium]|nr:glutamate-5-semialdehyde dehydrogenase [Rhodospirillaceae bacterium]|tara:strand:+ start:5480 stop:6778 length:1299 start_codon:yes stop_codon:yes gene_type:complete
MTDTANGETKFKDDAALHEAMTAIGTSARNAVRELSTVPSESKNKALIEAAKSIRESRETLKTANGLDMSAAEEKGISGAILDRLLLDDSRIDGMAKGLEDIAALDDPVGAVMAEWDRPNGLQIQRVRVPLGVIGIIYESRPNVTADAGGLCLKSGNAAILRGGSESFHSSSAIMDCLQDGLRMANLPTGAIQQVPTRDRAGVGKMLTMSDHIDIIVPRGGKSLIERVQNESRVPVIAHLDGNCHIFVDKAADPEMAKEVVYNAKMRRPGICGATESLVVDRSAAVQLLPPIIEALSTAGCEIRGDEDTQALDTRVRAATDEDWDTEYLDTIISVKQVDGVGEAINHINRHGSHHTDSIVTNDTQAATEFLDRIDSAIVLHNASTQFADGGEFGMGAEIGISTGRLHARGPVGVEQLTTFKYVVRGDGQVRP